jgi:hypothetical protein
MTQTGWIQTEATAPQMGQLRTAFLIWRLQIRRLRGTPRPA